MASPFPGMDPYIEGCDLWRDFHASLIAEIKRYLGTVAPERYQIRIDERSYLAVVATEGKDAHRFYPDLSVSMPREPAPKAGGKKGRTAVAETSSVSEPQAMQVLILDEFRERFIEIYESDPDLRLVTTIEILSPSNKQPRTEGWEQYQRKRQSLILNRVHLVEIDLLRGGERMPMVSRWPDSPYYVMVARGRTNPGRAEVWPADYRTPLPLVPIPLAKPDADLVLNLQPMVADIYRSSRYAATIDYTKQLTPPLDDADAAWLRRRVKPGRRAKKA